MSCDIYKFDNGLIINKENIDKISDSIFQSIKKELPEEAQIFEVYSFILDQTKDNLRFVTIKL